jgi:nicotinamide-nucleotide amidase
MMDVGLADHCASEINTLHQAYQPLRLLAHDWVIICGVATMANCMVQWGPAPQPGEAMSNSDTILDLAAQVGKALQDKGLILATAESCTGGGVAQAITEIAGSTGWFDCGFVTYSNASKTEMLDVSAALIAQMGSVSEEVAGAMASGALGSSNAHIAVSTTGIAGPTGAVPGKPVGTVCFGWANADTVHTERLVFTGDRRAVREQTVIHALQGLLRFIN